MDPLLLTLRLIHILAGTLWVGIAVFNPFFLMPALQEAGPEGGKVMTILQRRGLMTLLPLLAVLTILSGLGLFWRVSGAVTEYFRSPTAHTLSLGAVCAIVAFLIGMIVTRPAMLRAGTAMQSLAPSTPPEERARVMAEVQRLRIRGAKSAQVVAMLLLLAAGLMGVARYV
jgi:uncharacterized membrane protein